ncbi:MAG: hypothetical protein AMS26_11115 [Bacteroides sp. SM23_62]|nr:MAG: hypothetical protein AMS26_11115 [Bacteroides sp. SM23_62]
MAHWIIITGLIAMGIILYFAPWLLKWFGKIPGDIRIETDRYRILLPIVSMILISIILTLLINISKR